MVEVAIEFCLRSQWMGGCECREACFYFLFIGDVIARYISILC
jgi:hypothetical protein